MYFKALFEYQTQEQVAANQASSIDIIYEADDYRSAVKDAVRWFGNRRRACPEHFANLSAIAVSDFIPLRIQESGYYPGPARRMFYIWKSIPSLCPVGDEDDLEAQLSRVKFLQEKSSAGLLKDELDRRGK